MRWGLGGWREGREGWGWREGWEGRGGRVKRGGGLGEGKHRCRGGG